MDAVATMRWGENDPTFLHGQVGCHRAVYPYQRAIAVHRHTMFEFGLVRTGRYRLITSVGWWDLPAGSAFFIPTGVPHGCVADSREGTAIFIVGCAQLDPSYIPHLLHNLPVGLFALSEVE